VRRCKERRLDGHALRHGTNNAGIVNLLLEFNGDGFGRDNNGLTACSCEGRDENTTQGYCWALLANAITRYDIPKILQIVQAGTRVE
jgi:hypothetical protein